MSEMINKVSFSKVDGDLYIKGKKKRKQTWESHQKIQQGIITAIIIGKG